MFPVKGQGISFSEPPVVGRHPLHTPCVADILRRRQRDCLWDSWLEIKDETLRLIYQGYERKPRLERLKAVFAQIGVYAFRQI
jgi:hypothetical protein